MLCVLACYVANYLCIHGYVLIDNLLYCTLLLRLDMESCPLYTNTK